MPYDPVTGKYTAEDAGVEKRVTDITGKDSLLMQQADTQGAQAGNRRGLLNSSMSVSAAQSARINAALPIASQEAGQVHQTNMQGADIESRERMLGKDITSREGMQSKDIENTRYLQSQDITSREGMQGREITHQQTMQDRDNALREQISNLDREAQVRISSMNVAAEERQAASQLAASFESSYAAMIANIMANPEIPATERQKYMDHAARIRDSNLSLVEQLYSVELQWQTSNAPNPNPNAIPGGPPPNRQPIRTGLMR